MSLTIQEEVIPISEAGWRLMKEKASRLAANFDAACERIEERDRTITQLRLRVVQLEEDARAGMVPEAELADLRCKVEVLENSIQSYELSTGEHEAELAAMKEELRLSHVCGDAKFRAAEAKYQGDNLFHQRHYRALEVKYDKAIETYEQVLSSSGLQQQNEELAKRLEQTKAELATAWEAGRTAAAEFSERKYGVRAVADAIRALQPPGGKAKP